MLTQCPNCQTIYQISAGELGAAKGFVECGECSVQFNALDRIADEPSFANHEADVTDSDTQSAKPAPTFVLMEEGTHSPTESFENSDTRDTPAQTKSDEVDDQKANKIEAAPSVDDPELEPAIAATDEHDKTLELALLADDQFPEKSETEAIQSSTSADNQTDSHNNELTPPAAAFEINADGPAANSSLPPEEHEILFTDPLTDSSAASTEPEELLKNERFVADTKIDFDDVPPILQEELLAMQEPKSSGANAFWLVCAMVLLLGIVVQAAWHYKDPLLKRFPAAVPYAQRVCTALGCELDQAEALEPIQLVSRDVRTHPRYENALLVNASMVNTGTETISFPTVQLGLFDPTGTAIGIRQFLPNEYLDKSIEIDAGIPPGRSVHVVLELANTSDEATSFEFSFH